MLPYTAIDGLTRMQAVYGLAAASAAGGPGRRRSGARVRGAVLTLASWAAAAAGGIWLG